MRIGNEFNWHVWHMDVLIEQTNDACCGRRPIVN